MYNYLDEVPWNSVAWVIGPSGNAVGTDPDGFAVRLTGPTKGKRIPLDASGPWRPYTPPPEVLAAVEVLTERGIDGAMFEKLLSLTHEAGVLDDVGVNLIRGALKRLT